MSRSRTRATLTYKPLNVLGTGSDGVNVIKYQFILNLANQPKENSKEFQQFQHAITKNEWAFKTEYNDTEIKILKRYQPVFHGEPFSKNSQFIKAMPGKPLNARNCRELTFKQRLNLVTQLVMTLNVHHHTTARTGSAVIHGDLKSDNILFHCSRSTGKIEVNLIDYGLTMDIDDDPTKLRDKNKGALNPTYFPPEVLNRKGKNHKSQWGIKTDIYMISAVISSVMPTLYDEKIASISLTIQRLYDQFLKRMHAPSYADRPDSDETLSFFNTLSLLHQLYDQNVKDASLKQAYITKLTMLSYQKWHDFDLFDPSYDETNQRISSFLTSPFANNISSIAPLTTPEAQAACTYLNEMNIPVDNCVIAILLKSPALINELNQNQEQKAWPQLFLAALADFPNHILSLEEKREKAIAFITSILKTATSAKEIAEFVVGLEALGEDNKIDYLYKRQGKFQISLFNHKWENKPVSRTWLQVMKLASGYANRLLKAAPHSNPNPSRSTP